MVATSGIGVLRRLGSWFTPRMAESLVASGVIQASLVLSGIAVARLYDPTLRGQLGLILVLPAVAAQLTGFGIPSATTFFVARAGSWRPTWLLVRGVFVLQCATATVLLVGLDAVFLQRQPHPNWAAALAALPSAAIVLALAYAIHLAQGMNELRWFNVLRTLPSVFYTALLVVLVVSNRSLVVVTSLWVASQALAVAAIIIWLRRVRLRSSGEQPEVDRDEVLRYGAVGFVAQVSPVETFRLDQLFVAAFLPAHTLGLYVVAAGVSNLPRFVADAVSAIAFPTVASRLHNAHDARRLQMKYTLQCAAAAGLTTVVLMAVFPWLIPLLFGPSYSAAVEIAEVLVVASTVVAIRRVLSDCTRALGYAGIPTVGEVVSWVGLALGFALFGVSHGAIAVAAVLIGSALLAIATQVLLFERRAPRGGPPFGSAETALPVPE